MAVTITIDEVKDGFDTSASDDEINLAITIIDQAGACLDRNSVPDDIQRALKLYGVRHIMVMQDNSGRGTVTSETAPNGASRSYGQWKGAEGTPYRGLLNQLDRYGCVTSLLDNSNKLGVWSVGGGRCHR